MWYQIDLAAMRLYYIYLQQRVMHSAAFLLTNLGIIASHYFLNFLSSYFRYFAAAKMRIHLSQIRHQVEKFFLPATVKFVKRVCYFIPDY